MLRRFLTGLACVATAVVVGSCGRDRPVGLQAVDDTRPPTTTGPDGSPTVSAPLDTTGPATETTAAATPADETGVPEGIPLGREGAVNVFAVVDARTGDAYRAAARAGTDGTDGARLLELAFTGSALDAQRRSLHELAASGSLAADPGDPHTTVVGVQEENPVCAVVAVTLDDASLYALPDGITPIDAVAQLRLTGADWKVASLVESGTAGIDALTCAGVTRPASDASDTTTAPDTITRARRRAR